MLFEIHLARVVDPSRLLSEDITRDGKVKLMTWDEARAAGFAGLPEPPVGMTVRYVAANGRDEDDGSPARPRRRQRARLKSARHWLPPSISSRTSLDSDIAA